MEVSNAANRERFQYQNRRGFAGKNGGHFPNVYQRQKRYSQGARDFGYSQEQREYKGRSNVINGLGDEIWDVNNEIENGL